MKKSIKSLLILLIALIFISNINQRSIYGKKIDETVTILFTHDMHDHFYPYSLETKGEIKELGGFARLYSAIEKEKSFDPEALVLDAGDFSMGTLFQTIFSSHSPTLRLMGIMGYDATTFGNHEFDFRAEGLADSLQAAKNSGDPLPTIVASNTIFPADESGNLTPSLKKLQNSMDNYGVKDYIVLNRNGVKIGIFGLMGIDADSNAPMAEVEFNDMMESSKKVVHILKNEEQVDLIIALSHSGTKDKKSKSEDEILAKKVPDIDVIISGHSHSTLKEPIIAGNTIIASSGNYGENLGVMKIAKDDKGKWKLDKYEIKQINDSLPLDPAITERIDYFKDIVQEQYLDKFNMKFNDVLAYSPFSFTEFSVLGDYHREEPLGSLISDSYIYAVKNAEGENYKEIAAAIVPYGIVRDTFTRGNIRAADVFNVSSLGIGADKISGYPLIDVYLTGKELKTAAEVDASIQPIMGEAQLYMSGLNYRFNPKRMIFNKVTDAYLENSEGNREEILDDELYRVVVGLYSAQMLSVVGDKSFNLLSIVPKTEKGSPITDFEAQIIYEGDHEVKEWLALAQYFQSFDMENGIPQVPIYYHTTKDRKIVDYDASIIDRFKNPNKITLVIYLIILVFISFTSWLIGFILNRRKRKAFKNI